MPNSPNLVAAIAALLLVALLAAGCSGGGSPDSANGQDGTGGQGDTGDDNGDGGNGGGGGTGPLSAVVSSMQDVYASSKTPNLNYDRPSTECGYCFQTLRLRPALSLEGESWVFLRYRFDGIPVPVRVVSAALHFQHLPGVDPSSEDTISFSVYRVIGMWDESNLTWSNKPRYERTVVASGELSGSRFGERAAIDPSVVQFWLDVPAFNHGLVVIPASEGKATSQKIMYSHEGDGLGVTLELVYTTTP